MQKQSFYSGLLFIKSSWIRRSSRNDVDLHVCWSYAHLSPGQVADWPVFRKALFGYPYTFFLSCLFVVLTVVNIYVQILLLLHL